MTLYVWLMPISHVKIQPYTDFFFNKKIPIFVISFLIYQEVGFEIAFVNFKGSSRVFSFFLLFVIFGKGKETKQPTKEYLSSTFWQIP